MRFLSRSIFLGGLGLVFGCTSGSSSSPATADTCPRSGVVLASFRDVERDAEGVSYSVFGAYPDRVADFGRGSAVLSLLDQVWTSGNASCPDLPGDVKTAVDSALSQLSPALAAKDQEAAAYLANDIHAQMAPLFAYFATETPVEVVDMDALFLRIGLDAWFGHWDQFQTELTALQSDWATLKASANAKVPTCHRVAGTQSVVGDLDATLTHLEAILTAKDVDAAQVESDAGLLEVDILELLYDCAPDGVSPDVGLGSACAANSDCESGQVCDAANGGGKCAPDPANTNTGTPCTTTVDCGTDPRNACNNEVGDGYPGGYCTMEPCDDVKLCSPGATCVALPFETPACLKACVVDSDCRSDEGYVCQLFPTTPPEGFGPSGNACAFACKDDFGCTPPLTCDVVGGKCIP